MLTIDPTVTENSIGVLASDFADKNRSNLRELAFQQHGQKYAYLADSSPTEFDKANVRDGHYPMWGAIHFVAPTVNGNPSQIAGAFINKFNKTKLDENLAAATIGAGFVPACAMKVTHTTEVGPLTAFKPAFTCSCFFEKETRGTTSCQACTSSSGCSAAAPNCNYGYCEP
jgi:hypothetical protein